jgi:zeaxanthin glucosyltransferase
MKTAQSVGNIQLAQIPEFVDFERSKLPDHFFYCAPWHSPQRDVSIPFPWHQLDGRPILYVSLGTVQNRLQHLYYLLAQSCPDNMQLVMAMGRMDAQDQANALAVGVPANNAIVSNYAPQTELLPRAAVVVTHGGMNTALECLKLGKPMVIVPLCNDQPGVAARLHRLGVCAVVKSNQAHRKDVLTRAILKVSSTPSYQQSANRISERINKECPTIHETAELLEVGLSRSTPLSRGDFYEFARRISMEQPADDVTMSSPEWDRVQKTTVVLR